MSGLKSFLLTLDPIFIWYFSVINITYVVLLFLGSYKIYFRMQELKADDWTSLLHSASLPEISFIIPMYNEADHIIATVTNVLSLSYRYKKIIVINDGSLDQSMEVLKAAFELVVIPKFYEECLPTQKVKAVLRSKVHPDLLVIDKEHGRKSDAINAGINACTTQYFVGIDADTMIEDSAFEACIRPLLTSSETIAVGGTVSISNDCQRLLNRISTQNFPKNFITGVQSLEYLRAFLVRQGWDYGGRNFIISGAFCVFPKDLIISVGGFYPSHGEDMEMIVRLHRIMKKKKIPYKIFYLPDPVAWTQAPATWSVLGQQRIRWHTGLLESLFFHKSMCFNPTYDRIAFFTFPYWLIGEVLEPIVEVFGIAVVLISFFLGILHVAFFLLLVNITLVFTFIFTITCLLIEELSFRRYPSTKTVFFLALYGILENIGYRQCYLWWKLRACGRFLKNFSQLKKDDACIKARVVQCELSKRN